jgi:hypothetical protein
MDSQHDCGQGEAQILSELSTSRAIRVNGDYGDINNIPRDFARLLCEGPLELDHATRRNLTIAGFILPEQEETGQEEEVAVEEEEEGEFEPVDWNKDGTKYRVANPFLAMYYRMMLKKNRGLEFCVDHKLTNCADMLLRVIPYLTFAKVVGYPPPTAARNSPLSAGGLPYEQQYTSAIIDGFRKLNFKADCPQDSGKSLGKVDCFVYLGEHVTHAVETIMATRTLSQHKAHIKRFSTMDNYKKAAMKALLIIGTVDKVRKRVGKILEIIVGCKDIAGVEIIGLVPNIAHTAYTVIVNSREFLVECDLVARGLVTKGNTVHLCCVQQFTAMNPAPSGPSPASQQAMASTPLQPVWVRELCKNKKGIFTPLRGEVGDFRVTPTVNDIGGVAQGITNTTKSFPITVFQHGAGGWKEMNPRQVFQPTADQTFGFVVQK